MNKQNIAGLMLCCAPLYACNTAPKEQPQKPNVIYILADDLGYGDIEPYGQEIIKTPHLTQMTSEGMLFTQHYAGSTVSAPSRGSVMTGLHTGHSQIRGNKEIEPEGQQPMEGDTYTIGKMMKEQGYTTGIFGKWGLGYPESPSIPKKMGFDEFYGYNCQRQAHSYYPEHLWKNEEKIILEDNLNGGRKTYSQDLIHQEGLQFIRNNKDKPFFAMLTYSLPHAELNLPHDSIYHIYEDMFEETPYSEGGYHDSEKPRASFAAMVSLLDKYVGEVIQELKDLGIDDNTIVIFTSDNGPHMEGGADPDFFNSNGPLRGFKRDLYEGGIRVPMIVRYPNHIKAGSTTNHISAFWDLMPTLADLTNIELPANEVTDGISFLPTLLNKDTQKEHKNLYWEFHEGGGRLALLEGDWKMVILNAKSEEQVELYNLSDDLGETNNLVDANPEITKEMYDKLKSIRVESDIFPFYTK
ncbi:MAG: arylsulfatase [Bacteroidales bacterium]|nr:arylsulfatase [Bacteroidales bacterium]